MDDKERIAVLETKVDSHEKRLDEHENDIDNLKEVVRVVDKLSYSVDRQSENIDKMSAMMQLMADTTKHLEIKQAEMDAKQKYMFWDNVKELLTKPKFWKILGILTGITVGASAIINYIASLLK